MRGEAPKGWQHKPLSALAVYHNGRAFKPSDWSETGLPIIRISNMTNPGSEWNRYPGTDVDPLDLVANGDLLFSWSATLMAILWGGGPAILNQHIFKVVERPSTDRMFLRFLLEHHMDALAEISHGSTMKHIRRGALDSFHVPTPPLS